MAIDLINRIVVADGKEIPKSIKNLPFTEEQLYKINLGVNNDKKTPNKENLIPISKEDVLKYLSSNTAKQTIVTNNAHYVSRSDGTQLKIDRINLD